MIHQHFLPARGNFYLDKNDQDTILFGVKSNSSSIFMKSIHRNNTHENNPQKLFLLPQFPIFKVIPRLFSISTKNSKSFFNLEMLKATSPVISEFVEKNPKENNYNLDITDEENVLSKFEQLYQGECVEFNDDEITISQRITKKLQIKNCPNFLKPQSLYNRDCEVDSDGNRIYKYTNDTNVQVVICQKFFFNYLKREQLQTFKIITNQKEYNCNIFGIYSSNVISEILQKDPSINEFQFDFKDELNEFQSICDFFNFKEVDITSDNMDSLKEIAESLQINIITNKIDDFIKNYEENSQKIDEQQTIIDSIDHLFDLLYKINMHGIQKVKISIEQSKWSQTEENVQELAAFILQVVKSNFFLQKEMVDLLVLLNEEANEMNKLNILIPFIVEHLLNFYMISPSNKIINMYETNSSSINDSNNPNSRCVFNFIHLLYKRGIIQKEKIIEKLTVYDCQNQTLNAFFLPELFELNPKTINSITLTLADQNNIDSGFIKKNDNFSLFVDKYFPNRIDLYKNIIDNMEPDDQLTKSLRNDDVDKLQFIINTNEIDITKAVVPYNIFDDFETNLNFINYAALYGSIKCFKYLLLNHATIDKTSLYFAINGGNTEIIKIVDDKTPIIDDDQDKEKEEQESDFFWHRDMNIKEEKTIDYSSLDTIIASAIKMHRNDLFDWLFETKILNRSNFGNLLNDIALIAAKNGNIHSLIQIADKGIDIASQNIINCAAQNGFYTLTNFLISMKKSKVNIFSFEEPFSKESKINQSFVHFGNLSIFKLLNNIFKYGKFESAILYSIRYNYKKIVKYYFDEKRYMNLNETFIFSALVEAIKNKTDYWFDFLFEEFKKRKPSVFKLDLYSDLLNSACLNSNFKVVEKMTDLILKEKSNHNFTTAFTNAISSESTNICQYLLDRKVYINFEKISSVSQIGSINEEIFMIIIENVNQSTRYKLMKCIRQAIQKKNKKLIEFLLKETQLPDLALFDAVSTHDLEIVNLILNNNSKPSFINLKKPEGTALFIAAKNKDLDIVKRLLSVKGIDPSLTNVQNENILTLAVKNNDIDIIQAIFNFYGEDIQYKSHFVIDALLILSDRINNNPDNKMNWEIVKKIFENKYIDPNFCDSSTFLYKACYNNKIDVVKSLLELDRIDVNKYEIETYNTPLMISIEKDYTNIAEFLIQNPKTDLNLRNFNDDSALIIAVKNNRKFIVDLLINNERFDPDQSKLGFSFFNANSEMAKQLSSSNFLDVNYTFEIMSNYLLEEKTALVHSVFINDIDTINFIINHPSFDIYKSDINKAIFMAAKNNNVEVFRQLLKFVDINICDENSRSLFLYSVKHLSGNIIDEILNNQQFEPIESQIFDSFIQLITNKKDFYEQTRQIFRPQMLRYNQIQPQIQNPQRNRRFQPQIRRNQWLPKNHPLWQNQDEWQRLWQGQIDILNQETVPDKSSIIEIVTKIYNFDKEHSHLIDFQQLLPDGKSFFTVIPTDYDEIGLVSDFLLNHGVDPNMADSNGVFPLVNAIKLNSFKFISSLINSNKINYSQIGTNTTYLHVAALFVDDTAFSLICEKTKIDINSKDKINYTPLMIACLARNSKVINFLFEKDDLDYLHDVEFYKNKLFRNFSQNEYEDSIKSKVALHQKIIYIISEDKSVPKDSFANEYLNFVWGYDKVKSYDNDLLINFKSFF